MRRAVLSPSHRNIFALEHGRDRANGRLEARSKAVHQALLNMWISGPLPWSQPTEMNVGRTSYG